MSSKRLVPFQKNSRLSDEHGGSLLQFFGDHLGCVQYKAIAFHFYVDFVTISDGKPVSNFLGKIDYSSTI